MTLRRQQRALYAAAAMGVTAAVCTLGLSTSLPLRQPRPIAAAESPVLAAADRNVHDGLPPRGEFEPLLALPLRRPLYDAAPVVEAPKAKVIPPLRLTLLGTIMEPGQALAVLRDSGGKTQFLEVGQSLEDATVLTIEAAAVRLEYHGATRTLSTDPNADAATGAPGSSSVPGSSVPGSSIPGSDTGSPGGPGPRNR